MDHGSARRARRRRLGYLAGGVFAGLLGLAVADVVLRPGTVSGRAGLAGFGAGFSSSSGNVHLSNGSFSGNGAITGNDFTLTIEGGQTYSWFSMSQSWWRPGDQVWFQHWKNGAGIAVTAGATVEVDLRKPWGTVALQSAVTGGTVLRTKLRATRTWSDESATSDQTVDGSTTALPAVADPAVAVSGSITVAVQDEVSGNVLCNVELAIAQEIVAVASGATTTLSKAWAVSPASCDEASISGKVELSSLPAAQSVTDVYAYSGHPEWRSQRLSGNGESYAFKGLQKTFHHPTAYLSLHGGGFLRFPDGSRVDLTAGGNVTRDFTARAALAEGRVEVEGPAAASVSRVDVNLYGDWSRSTAGAYAARSTALVPTASGRAADYQLALTPGPWAQKYLNLYGYRSLGSTWESLSVSVSAGGLGLEAVAGEAARIPTDKLSVSEAVIVFDVIEPPGAPTIGISNPSISAWRSDGQGGTSLFGQTGISNAATPSVRLVGPAGEYTFQAHAQVEGSHVRFASSTVSIGMAVNTPVGDHVTITPKDRDGQPTPIELEFETITGAGETTASVTDVGPGAPADHDLLKIIDDKQYLNLSSSAQFPGKVEVCVRYSLEGLGITAAKEPSLKLQQYVCSGPTTCAWQIVNGRLDGGGAVDTANHVVCGVTTTLSTFAITLPTVILVPPTGTCIGGAEAPAQLSTDAGLCSARVDNHNQIAGGCSGGGGGLASCTFDGHSEASLGLGRHTIEIVGTAVDTSTASCKSYVTIVDREGPRVTCPVPVTVECAGRATSHALAASCADNCGSCVASCGAGPFAIGETTVACNAVDRGGNTGSCTTSVKVVDTRSPALALEVSPAVLWPPNHKLVPIQIARTASDACDPEPKLACDVISNEPAQGPGNRFDPDVVWNEGRLFLRAERLANDHGGRVYTIRCTATDRAGNATVRTATVTVPLDRDRPR